jgi:TatD DNase family protein
MPLIDSHAHLTMEPLAADVDAVLARAVEAGVEHVITIGTDLADARRAVALANRDSRVSAVVGFHPHESGKVTDECWTGLGELIVEPTVVAIGEMGLDYHYDFADRAVQHEVFARQLEVASTTQKPIVIHSREAYLDTAAILRSAGYAGKPVVFHCFTGTEAEACDIRDNGWRISFTGVVTFKNATELQRIAKDYPAAELMIETDSPYLSPVPVRHIRPNEPSHVMHTARFLAQLRGESFEALAVMTNTNTRQFFQLTSDFSA